MRLQRGGVLSTWWWDDGSMATEKDTMQKAMRHKAVQNLDFGGMASSSLFLYPHLFYLLSLIQLALV
jgi:hypothetical protein